MKFGMREKYNIIWCSCLMNFYICGWRFPNDVVNFLAFLSQSLRARGIRFPGRDNESLAPIFTPPRSVSAPDEEASLAQQMQHDVTVQTFTADQTKEVFDVARNSVELLTTVLSSSPQQDALKVCSYIINFYCQCKQYHL